MSVEPLRQSFRRQLRESALEITHTLTIEQGWDRVRVSEVAARTGVSRPTIYKEFGDKQGLGEALVLRETERFLVGVTGALADHADDLPAGIVAAVRLTLQEAAASPLLHATLTSARGVDGLLPALTTRSAPVLSTASELLGAWFAEHLPDHDRHELLEAVDALVRLTVSHVVLPAYDSDETARRLSAVALRYLRLPGPTP